MLTVPTPLPALTSVPQPQTIEAAEHDPVYWKVQIPRRLFYAMIYPSMVGEGVTLPNVES